MCTALSKKGAILKIIYKKDMLRINQCIKFVTLTQQYCMHNNISILYLVKYIKTHKSNWGWKNALEWEKGSNRNLTYSDY